MFRYFLNTLFFISQVVILCYENILCVFSFTIFMSQNIIYLDEYFSALNRLHILLLLDEGINVCVSHSVVSDSFSPHGL